MHFITGNFNVCHQSIQDLKIRRESLEIFEIKPTVLILTERNMHDFELCKFNIVNYWVTAWYTCETTKGGGNTEHGLKGIKYN